MSDTFWNGNKVNKEWDKNRQQADIYRKQNKNYEDNYDKIKWNNNPTTGDVSNGDTKESESSDIQGKT